MADGIGGEEVFRNFSHKARKIVKSGKRLARKAKHYLKSKITGRKPRVIHTHKGKRKRGYKLSEAHKKAISAGLKKYHRSGGKKSKKHSKKFKRKAAKKIRSISRRYRRR